MPLVAIGLGLATSLDSRFGAALRARAGDLSVSRFRSVGRSTALLGSGGNGGVRSCRRCRRSRPRCPIPFGSLGCSLTPGRNRQWVRSALATTQIALALALLFGSALAITAAQQTVNGVLGFDKSNVLVAQLNLPERNYSDADTRRRFIARVTDAMRVIPAVSKIGASSIIPRRSTTQSPGLSRGRGRQGAEARYAPYRSATPKVLRGDQDPLGSGPVVRRFRSG